MKFLLQLIFNFFGFRVLKTKSYNKILEVKTSGSRSTSYNKNDLLAHLFTILKNQNFYPEVIYDVGANTGSWTKKCLEYFPNAHFLLFEPQVALKEEIEKTLKGYKNFELFQIGIGKINGKMPFTIHDRKDSSSYTYSREEAVSKEFSQINLPISKLETIVKAKKLPPPVLLKIDAEGMDIEVLEGAGTLLGSVEIIMIEVGVMNRRIRNSVLETVNFLDQNGFIFFDITDLNRPHSSEVLWLAEFVFVKKGGKLDKNYN